MQRGAGAQNTLRGDPRGMSRGGEEEENKSFTVFEHIRKHLNFKGLNIKEHGVTHNYIENYANFLNEVIIFSKNPEAEAEHIRVQSR